MVTDSKSVLPFMFLVVEDHSERWGTIWTARSVLTGHAVEARTADSAIEHLQRALDAAILTAGRHGLSPEAWWRQAQDSGQPHVLEFMRAFVGRQVEQLSRSQESYELTATVARAA